MGNDALSGLSPEDLAKLMSLGTLDERSGALDQQLAQALALGRPSNVQHSTGMGAGLGGLGDVLNRVGGGIQAGGIRGEQAKLLAQKDAARGAFGKAQAALDPGDVSALFFGDEQSAPQRAQALAAALRGQQQLGQLGVLTGDKVIGNAGQSLLKGAADQQGILAQAGQQQQQSRLQRALQEQQAKSQVNLEGVRQTGDMETARFKAQEEMRRLQAELGAKGAQQKAAGEAAGKKQMLDMTEGLRKEFMGNPVVKEFQAVRTAFDKIKTAATGTPSPAGDVALLYGYMKIVDPGSSVKEGELATASNTTNVPGQILNMYNKAREGTLLSPGMRKDFLGQAHGMYQAHADRAGQLANQYKAYATKQGAVPEDVVFDLTGDAQPLGAVAKPAQDPEAAKAAAWAQANPNDPRARAILEHLNGGL